MEDGSTARDEAAMRAPEDTAGESNVVRMTPPAPAAANPSAETRPKPDPAWFERAAAEAALIQAECLFNAKAQFEACAVWQRHGMWLGIGTAILGALTAGTIATAFSDAGIVAMGENQGQAVSLLPGYLKLGVAGTALVAGVIAAAARFLDPQGRAALHGAAAKRYVALAEEARLFRTLHCVPEAGRADLLTTLRAMSKRRAEIHEAAPVIPEGAFRTAKQQAETDKCIVSAKEAAGRA
jgi:hypothetical protein